MSSKPLTSFEDQAKDASTLQPYYNSSLLKEKHTAINQIAGTDFVDWALKLTNIRPEEYVLDAGSGWGRFTWKLVDVFGVPAEHITACDLSDAAVQGLLKEAERRGVQIHAHVCDLSALAFDQPFDLVMANHVLYHLPDIHEFAQRMKMLVKPNGRALVTTNSDLITSKVISLHYEALRELGIPFKEEGPSPFSMENGETYFRGKFRQIERHYFDDELRFEEAEAFMRIYLSTGRYRSVMERDNIRFSIREQLGEVVRRNVQQTIDECGVMTSPVKMGAFLLSEPVLD